jgi:hypothetical protein
MVYKNSMHPVKLLATKIANCFSVDENHMTAADIHNQGFDHFFTTSWRDRRETSEPLVGNYYFTTCLNRGVRDDASLTNMFVAVGEVPLYSIYASCKLECLASQGFSSLTKKILRAEESGKECPRTPKPHMRFVYLFCNNYPFIPFPVKEHDGSIEYIEKSSEFSRYIFGDSIEKLEVDHGIMYAQASCLSSGEDERSMARAFYFVSKDDSPESIQLIDSMVAKLADYLEGSLDLIRDGIQMQIDEQKEKDAPAGRIGLFAAIRPPRQKSMVLSSLRRKPSFTETCPFLSSGRSGGAM